jgi:pimeloyl-ACP methyl ester carboxylesterase
METRQVVVGGVRSPVTEGGAGEPGEAVVFVHGNPGSAHDWDFALGAVAEFARVIAPDMPAYGDADRPREWPYTVNSYAEHLAGILDQTGVTRAHLVLHDFGGPWGLSWAVEHPDAFASVTLIDTGIFPGYRWHKFAKIWRTPIAGELFQAIGTRSGTRMFLNRDNPKPLPKEFTDRMYDSIDAGTKRAVLKLYRSSDLGADTPALSSALLPLDRPALVIWGDGDVYLPVAYAERQREAFPAAEVVVIRGAGHWPFVDDPDAVREPLVSFLRAQIGAPAPSGASA